MGSLCIELKENHINSIITGRNEVVAKVMFLLVSVILLTEGGGLSQCMLRYHHHQPREGSTPHPREGSTFPPPPRKEPPPPEESTPPPGRKEAPPGIQSMSGRYAYYWNAFLFQVYWKLIRSRDNFWAKWVQDKLCVSLNIQPSLRLTYITVVRITFKVAGFIWKC